MTPREWQHTMKWLVCSGAVPAPGRTHEPVSGPEPARIALAGARVSPGAGALKPRPAILTYPPRVTRLTRVTPLEPL